jgi:Ca2+-binding RTX toxin-like protein
MPMQRNQEDRRRSTARRSRRDLASWRPHPQAGLERLESRRLLAGDPIGIVFGSRLDDVFEAGVSSDFDGVNDVVQTFEGRDLVDLSGVVSDSLILTDEGQDELIAGHSDQLWAGAGHDVLEASLSTGSSTLRGSDGDDELIAGAGDTLEGDEGNDTLYLNVLGVAGGNNRASGGNGHDRFFLGINDRVLGGAGDDQFFTTGLGGNSLTGGAGSDRFWIALAGLPSAPDTITDFDPAVDRLGMGGADLTVDDLSIEQEGAHVVISLAGTRLVILQNLAASSWDPADFLVPDRNLIVGTAGNDTIDTSVVPGVDGMEDAVILGSGNDLADAAGIRPVPETRVGQAVFGGAGTDELLADGRDRLFGGSGEDILDASGGEGGNRLYGGDGDDQLLAGQHDRLLAGSGNDLLIMASGAGGNRAYGDAGDDTFVLGSHDRAFGGAGADAFFVTGSGANTLSGGTGGDTFWIAVAELPTEVNTVTDFTPGTDQLGIGLGGDGPTSVDQLDIRQRGTDAVVSFAGRDLALLLDTSVGDLRRRDFILAGAGEALFGSPDADLLEAGRAEGLAAGIRQVFAGGGDDLVAGDEFRRSIFGGNGDDELESGRHDHLFGGAGNDILEGTSAASDARLYGGSGDDEIFPGGGSLALGGPGHDRFQLGLDDGQTRGARVHGQAGDDTFLLGAADRVLGGAGNDRFFLGQGGGNTLIGGTGTDTFWITESEPSSAVDTIVDFTPGEDRLGLGGPGASLDALGLTQVGADVSLAIAGQELVLLMDVQAADLTAEHFLVVGDVDAIFGDRGADFLTAGVTDNLDGDLDFVLTGGGNDLVDLVGTGGASRVVGGGGDDELLAGGRDRLAGGVGADYLQAARQIAGARLYGGSGNDRLVAGTGGRLFGGDGDDRFVLNNPDLGGGGNRARGQGGDDRFYLGSGDRVAGGEGNDAFFTRDGGDNILTGGQGIDVFWLASGQLPGQANVITDFTPGTDVLGLSGIDARFEDLQLQQVGADVSVSLAGQGLVVLRNTDAAALRATSFVFLAFAL